MNPIEMFKAWLRGVRIFAPAGVRGRVYERVVGCPGVVAKTTLKASLVPSRVFRAVENAWYKRNPSTGELTKE